MTAEVKRFIDMSKKEKKQYRKVHLWLNKNFIKNSKCDICGIENKSRFEWALIKNKTYVFDRDNFMVLCVRCHRKYDENENSRLNKSLSKKGKIPNNIVSVIKCDYESGVVLDVYRSISEAAIKNRILRTSILNNISGLSRKAGGYLWKRT